MTTPAAPRPDSSPENRELISLLLVEDNNGDARLVQDALSESSRVRFRLERVDRLTAAVARLAKESFDVILLDLTLPDAWGLDTFLRIREAAPHTPIMVLTGLDDETLGIMAVQQGAQEYLVKGQATGPLIVRCLRYALQRHRMQEDLRGLSLTDELTGLFNRRGFTLLSRQLLKLCSRMSRPLVLLFADLENIHSINTSSGGSAAGDEALRQVGMLLRRTFRDSDVLARIGGSSFTVLAVDSPDERGLKARLEETLKDFNALRGQGQPRLALGIGALQFTPEGSVSIEDLMAQAVRLRTGEAPVQGPSAPDA
ncbi:MAG TPA: diguanylate cyclase [Planctomycetota bacterium]|nr:diguanylate cyclase [Planctomycetota bacterium]